MFSLSTHQQQGVGLVEVMVALLLLAVGGIGFAALHMTAIRDALVLRHFAIDSSIQIQAHECPPVSTGVPLMCLIASWGDTTPTIGAADTDCVTANGDYKIGSSCFVMEAY